jgi:hypothetical protein
VPSPLCHISSVRTTAWTAEYFRDTHHFFGDKMKEFHRKMLQMPTFLVFNARLKAQV